MSKKTATCNPASLQAFVRDKSANTIKDTITSLSKTKKGPAFEQLLAELYRANGWLAQIQGGRGDDGADILLYHPKTPSRTSLIVQAKNHAQPLTYDQTRLELVKFEEKARERYNCQQFRIVSVSGFVKDADALGDFNMLLDDWEHVEALVEHYDPENTTEPQIELYAHNRSTYEQINELWEESDYVAVVQATGTGKSFLIAKVLADFLDKRKIVLAPSTYILEQQKGKVPWLFATDYMTYAKLGRMNTEEIAALSPELIVLDEFHRCGADIWGTGVQALLDSNPEAKVIGTSATPIRYLDNQRDMAEELFDGVVAVDLSLAEAIARRILPAPTYISALYTLNEEIASLLSDVASSSRNEEEKAEYREEIKKIKLDWETTSGIPEILKTHLPPGIDKIIVFCRNQQHLDEMEIEVQRWFLKAGTHARRKTYRVLSSDPESNRNLDDFKSAGGIGTVHLLFSIDMLNEGLHIPEVGAVLLLRPTESPIIFYQQIGRCIEVGKDHMPVIFDLVNNFRTVRANDFFKDLEEARETETQRRTKHGLAKNATHVHVEELAKPIEEIFGQIRERLGHWEVMFEALVTYEEKYGDCNVPRDWGENSQLAIWVVNQRSRRCGLSEDRIKRLEKIGFVWNILESIWEKMFTAVSEYREAYEHCNVPREYENKALAMWVYTQRDLQKKCMLHADRLRRLEEIDFDWNPIKSYWEKMFAILCEYRTVHGHCNVPSKDKENPQLSTWVENQRAKRRRAHLSEDRIKRLEVIGFVWDPKETAWEEMFAALCEYKAVHGCCDLPRRSEEKQLATWVFEQRHTKKEGRLSADKTRRLEEVGFVWDSREAVWEEMFTALCTYRAIHSHCNVPNRWQENIKLAKWVSHQRSFKKKGTLSTDRVRRLDELDFEWEKHDAAWERMFALLSSFGEIHGHFIVPSQAKNKQLASWISGVRQKKKRGRLPENIIRRLEEIGFVWDPREAVWERMFAALCEYRETSGHCNVPSKDKENPQLAAWVETQRGWKKKGKMPPDRVQRLDGIGFEWELSKK